MTVRDFLIGRYDRGMLEWGGENIEQSLRAWMCGGRVIVERQAKIGHVFSRKLKPGRVKVSTVERNHARAAFVWLDDWLKYFEFKHRRGNLMLTDMGPYIDERLELRHRLKCGKFDDFVDMFRPVFDQRNLFMDNEISLQDMRSGFCITGKQLSDTGKIRDRPVELVWEHCQMYDNGQRFGPIMNDHRMRSTMYERCFQKDKKNHLGIAACDTSLKNANQNWRLRQDHLENSVEGSGEQNSQCIMSPASDDGVPKVGSSVDIGPCAIGDRVALIRGLYRGIDRD